MIKYDNRCFFRHGKMIKQDVIERDGSAFLISTYFIKEVGHHETTVTTDDCNFIIDCYNTLADAKKKHWKWHKFFTQKPITSIRAFLATIP